MDAPILLSLKIGRRVFDITEKDAFLDNGSCVQILTRKIPSGIWHYTSPRLTKKAIREIEAFEKVQLKHGYGSGCKVFGLKVRARSRSLLWWP